MFGNYLQRTTSADDIFRCIFSWRFKGLNVDKKLCGPRREKKLSLGQAKAQTSLRFRSDLEITQLHQTRPSAAVRPWHFLGQKGFSSTTFWGLDICLFGLVIFFQFPLDFLMRWSNKVNINPRVSKIKKLTPVLTTAIIINDYRLEWSCNRIFFNLNYFRTMRYYTIIWEGREN